MRIYLTIITLVVTSMILGAILALVAEEAYGAAVSASVPLTEHNCMMTIKLCKCK